MLDQTTLKGRIKQVVQGIPSQFDQIALLKNTVIKMLPANSYLQSPLTGAQINVLPSVEEHGGSQWLYLTIHVPVAAALAGQNMIHNGLEALPQELKCLRRLLKYVLTYFQLTADEINQFLTSLEVQLLELTWHTATSSRRAATLLQARTITHFKALQKAKGRHDVEVNDVDIWWRNDKTCMLVTFKDDSQFRQYIKAEQATSRTKANRRACFVSKKMRSHFAAILTAIDTHLRNEVILSQKLLAERGLLHPRSWTAEKLETAIEHVMTMGRLNQRRVSHFADLKHDGLSPEVVATAERYFAGKVLVESMKPQVLSKHRGILQKKNLDIAEKRPPSRAKSISRAGMQLQYSKRWVPDKQLGVLAVGEHGGPAIFEMLDQKLAEIEAARQVTPLETEATASILGHCASYGEEPQ